jgi:hypothetical protein
MCHCGFAKCTPRPFGAAVLILAARRAELAHDAQVGEKQTELTCRELGAVVCEEGAYLVTVFDSDGVRGLERG